MNALLFLIFHAEIGPGSLDDIQGQNANTMPIQGQNANTQVIIIRTNSDLIMLNQIRVKQVTIEGTMISAKSCCLLIKERIPLPNFL